MNKYVRTMLTLTALLSISLGTTLYGMTIKPVGGKPVVIIEEHFKYKDKPDKWQTVDEMDEWEVVSKSKTKDQIIQQLAQKLRNEMTGQNQDPNELETKVDNILSEMRLNNISMLDIDQKRDFEGRTVLMIAVENGYDSIAQRLLTAGANPNLQDRKGHTALMKAVYRNQGGRSVIRLLVQKYKANKSIVNNEKKTAYDMAKEMNLKHAAEALI